MSYVRPLFHWEGHGCKGDLMSRRLVLRVMRRMVAVSGMTAWGRAHVRVMSEEDGAGRAMGWGLSGFKFIAESHVAVHTDARDGLVCVQVFSCRDFTGRSLGKELHRILSPARAYENTVETALEVSEWNPNLVS